MIHVCRGGPAVSELIRISVENRRFSSAGACTQTYRTPTHLRILMLWVRKVGRCRGQLQLSYDKQALHTQLINEAASLLLVYVKRKVAHIP